ncbi:uncharacterized protein LOC129583900 isoform X2 [Paramacrobiotus metropolitanus]|nr:uncharacterized protein LOC129583900 isoform X2 [Paramacrobiotus metropolitanus]
MPGYPQFDGTLMTERECNSRPRNSCWFNDISCLYGSISQKITKNVKETVTDLECQDGASVQEFLDAASSIATNSPNRAVAVHLNGKITNQTFAHMLDPIKNQVIELTFSDFYNRHKKVATSKIGALPLAYLLHLKFEYGRDLVIRKQDFVTFTYLRRLEFYRSSIASIERDTFTDLAQLRSFQLETGYEGLLGYEVIITKESELCDDPASSDINPLHCNCEYVWLRNWLKANPHLRKERAEGELYVVGNHPSAEAKKQPFILAAIGCS